MLARGQCIELGKKVVEILLLFGGGIEGRFASDNIDGWGEGCRFGRGRN